MEGGFLDADAATTVAEIVIPHTTGTAALDAALDCLDQQSEPAGVCLVDNAAPPASLELARKRGARIVSMGENAGFGRAVNAAVRSSRADLVILLNDDCQAGPDFVAEIINAYQVSGAPMIAAVLLSPDGLIDSAGVDADRSLVAYDYLHGTPHDPGGSVPPAPLGPTGGAAGFSRNEFLAVGGFDESFFAYLEDVDLALRMRARGHECVLAWRAVAVHHHSATLGSGSADKNRLMGESRGILARKWAPAVSRTARLRGLAHDAVTYTGKTVVDRNLAAMRGRIAARRISLEQQQSGTLDDVPLAKVSLPAALRRRLARRT